MNQPAITITKTYLNPKFKKWIIGKQFKGMANKKTGHRNLTSCKVITGNIYMIKATPVSIGEIIIKIYIRENTNIEWTRNFKPIQLYRLLTYINRDDLAINIGMICAFFNDTNKNKNKKEKK